MSVSKQQLACVWAVKGWRSSASSSCGCACYSGSAISLECAVRCQREVTTKECTHNAAETQGWLKKAWSEEAGRLNGDNSGTVSTQQLKVPLQVFVEVLSTSLMSTCYVQKLWFLKTCLGRIVRKQAPHPRSQNPNTTWRRTRRSHCSQWFSFYFQCSCHCFVFFGVISRLSLVIFICFCPSCLLFNSLWNFFGWFVPFNWLLWLSNRKQRHREIQTCPCLVINHDHNNECLVEQLNLLKYHCNKISCLVQRNVNWCWTPTSAQMKSTRNVSDRWERKKFITSR